MRMHAHTPACVHMSTANKLNYAFTIVWSIVPLYMYERACKIVQICEILYDCSKYSAKYTPDKWISKIHNHTLDYYHHIVWKSGIYG